MNKRRAIAVACLAASLFLVYSLFFNSLDSYEAGIAWNRISGEVWLQGPGYYFTPPWVAVSCVDTRPRRVCVTTAGRGFNCKLVRFVPEAYREFVAVEGFRYYWWSNRLSFNSGYDEEYRGMRDLLRGHAYGTSKYSFIATLQEYAPSQ